MTKTYMMFTITATMLAACTLPEDFQGSVTQISDHTVTVRGAYSMRMDGSFTRPTQAMVQQAQAICPNAKYLSATAVTGDVYFFDYLFMCK